jgi:hypothetical protein
LTDDIGVQSATQEAVSRFKGVAQQRLRVLMRGQVRGSSGACMLF